MQFIFTFVFQGVYREKNCHSLHQLLLNTGCSSAWMFFCLQVSLVVKLSLCYLLYARIWLPVSIQFCHSIDVVVELYTWHNVVALPSHLDTGQRRTQQPSPTSSPSRWKTLLELQSISHSVQIKDMWHGFDVKGLKGFSTYFDVISWEIWTSPKRHLSTVVTVGRSVQTKNMSNIHKATNWIGSGSRGDFYRLNFLSLIFKVQLSEGKRMILHSGIGFLNHTRF